ncbi:cell wall synthase accessory phosphoprotein MacP [Streptococcus sp. CSL10205-OR2]|uniref:cell wall synthase accessory phosphoprotein MacP n=1 Tax=Streptococcus sp. CSL10205-OR2 TaxID=2980558 RepID=UPI0021DB0736|nr:cell wall synthase accessory phosphoprotein MacP [Streptococcus sp. CSL10205-OR2]MCU9534407.1 cell wall synthase accessory phosphoprotein MacP [Streptococcus sp. CSL10205-OR2]
MGKPLLTDEIIRRANAKKPLNSQLIEDEDTKIIPVISDDYSNFMSDDDRSEKQSQMIKSRRIENAKRRAFSKKLNLILVIVVLLLAALMYAIFKI